MAASTTYDVRLRYIMQDHASRGLKTLNSRLEETSRRTGLLSRGLGKAGAAVAAVFGVRTAKKYLVDYNRQLEDARSTMGGLIHMTTQAGMAKSLAVSAKLVKDLETAAKTSTATTADMVGFARETVQPLVQAGMATDKLAKFTASAVVAARAFGDEQIAAFDIQQGLTKGVSIRDRFMMKLLATARMTKDEFNAMDTAGRLEFLEGALNNPAIREMAEHQAKTFSGVFSTFQDNLEIAGGKIGSALFAKLTATFQRWNAWIDSNGTKIAAWGQSLGDKLVSAFEVLERVGKFFVDNGELLLTLAKVWAGTKIAGALGGGLGGGLFSGGTLFKKIGGALLAKNVTGLGVKMASFGASVTGVGGALFSLAGAGGPIALAAGAFIGIYSWWKGKKEEEARTTANIDKAVGQMEEYLASSAFVDQKMSGGILQDPLMMGKEYWKGEQSQLNLGRPAAQAGVARLAKEFDLLSEGKEGSASRYGIKNFTSAMAQDMGLTTDQETRLTRVFDAFNNQLKDNYNAQVALAKILDPSTEEGGIKLENENKNRGQGDTNVTIQRIEVESNDPDRFVFGMTEAIRDYRKNPNQSRFNSFEGG